MNRSRRRAASLLAFAPLPNPGEHLAAPASRLRDSCPECRSHHLVWGPAKDLPFVVPREAVDDALDLVANLGDLTDAEAWLCRDCRNFGVFSGSWVRF